MINIDKEILELTQYAELEGSEWGQTAWALMNMWQSRTLISSTLTKALAKEIKAWLKDVKKNATIVEEVVEPKPYTVKSLEWDL